MSSTYGIGAIPSIGLERRAETVDILEDVEPELKLTQAVVQVLSRCLIDSGDEEGRTDCDDVRF